MSKPTFDEALRVIYQEARYLDHQQWDDWLSLFAPDCTFWVPSWRNEHELIEDPTAEISFLYADARRTLEERVRRLRSGKTLTAMPLPRTVHMISNPVEVEASAPERTRIASSWLNNLFNPRTYEVATLFGHYEHELVRTEAGIVIQVKKITLCNDRVPTVLDIYSV